MKRFLALFVLACAGFVLTSALVGSRMPEPDLGQVSAKLAWYEPHREDYDVVFFGSSRIYRGIVPAVFDREMARRGHPVRSFNFGVAGMGGHETSALIRRVLRDPPRRLRWVVVELTDWDASLRPENRFKPRMVAWHDLPETVSAVRTVWDGDEPAAARLGLIGSHLLHLAARTTAAGRGRALLGTLRSGDPPRGRRRDDLGEAGFAPFSQAAYATPSAHPFRRRFLTMLPEYRTAVRRLDDANRAPASPDPAAAEALAEQVALIRRAGATPIHLITPTARPTPALYRLAATGRVPWLLAFNDPQRYPELFTVAHRFDAEHLTTDGARLFSIALAERFAWLLDEGGRAPHRAEPAGGAVRLAAAD